MFGEDIENDISDMAALQGDDAATVLRKLFHTEIENIRNAKADSDSKMAEKLIKSIRSIGEEFISANLNRAIIGQFDAHEKVLPTEDNITLLV